MDHKTFIALSMSTADGFLGLMIAEALQTGSRQWGYIISAYSQTKFRVDVYPPKTSDPAISKEEYLDKVKIDMAPLEANVISGYMGKNDIGLNVAKTGPALVRMVYEGKVSVSAKDSPQYNAGKDMVSARYRL